jgi:hypothetical protein
MLLDAGLGLANIIKSGNSLEGSIISGSSGINKIVPVSSTEPAGFIKALGEIDPAAGISGSVISFIWAIQRKLYGKFAKAISQFLDVTLGSLGVALYDDYIYKTMKKQSAVVDGYSRSKVVIAFFVNGPANAYARALHSKGEL